jgi:hypothetical protein
MPDPDVGVVPSRPEGRGPRAWFNGLSTLVLALATASLIVATAYRIATGDDPFAIASLSFEQLVSLLLALFSIGLSLLFYHMANRTANQFYFKMFEFAKDSSVSIGAMEAGVTARLTQIHDNYEAFSRRFEQRPSPDVSMQLGELRSAVEQMRGKESTEVSRLEQVASRHDVPVEVIEAIKNSVSVVGTSADAVSRKMDDLEEAVERSTDAPRSLLEFLRQRFVPQMRDHIVGDDWSDEALSSAFQATSKNFTRAFLAEMRGQRLASEKRELTPQGLALFRTLLTE